MDRLKAIELLHFLTTIRSARLYPDEIDAIKVGEAGLKRIGTMRSFGINQAILPLPGENPVIDTSRSLHSIKEILESPLGREPRH